MGGAAAMSVLCAERDFAGSLDDLAAARAAADLPAVAKDFTVFPEQVAAQRLAGADAILVILAMVSDDEARRLLQAAELLGMDALVETHSAEEVERALALEARVVGVNARDLDTLAVDRERQLGLVSGLPDSVVRVAESGISSRADVEAARDAGADAVLVGTALMRGRRHGRLRARPRHAPLRRARPRKGARRPRPRGREDGGGRDGQRGQTPIGGRVRPGAEL